MKYVHVKPEVIAQVTEEQAEALCDPANGDPTVEDWADAIGTINYEVVARIGRSVERRTT